MAKEAAFQLARAGKDTADGIGLSVNTVTPGFIAAEMIAAMPEKALTKATSQIPVGRVGHPDEVARVVHFPRRRRLPLITGQVWGVNSELDM